MKRIMLNRLIYVIVKLFHCTYRYRYVGLENLGKCRKSNYILGVWHQNLFSGILAQFSRPHIVIVSKSRDAEPVAYLCRKMGTIVCRGSSKKGAVDKGGKLAKMEMIEKLKEGYPGAVTVDGPKGPAFIVKPGIVDMAKKAEVQIIPYLPIAEKYWSFKSWDKFRLPKLFSRIIIFYGPPLFPEELSFESCQQRLKKELDELEGETKEMFASWSSLSKKNN